MFLVYIVDLQSEQAQRSIAYLIHGVGYMKIGCFMLLTVAMAGPNIAGHYMDCKNIHKTPLGH